MIISDIMDNAEIKNTRAVSFDIIADIYEKARPGYPDEVYEEVEKYTGYHQTGKVFRYSIVQSKT